MSYDKFAPMTSALLARKGEAAPSPVAGQRVPSESQPRTRKPNIRSPKKAEAAATAKKKMSAKRGAKRRASKSDSTKKRRVVLTLSTEEFARVESAAQKRNNTAPQLARDALFTYLSAIRA